MQAQLCTLRPPDWEGFSKTPQYFLSTLSKPAGPSATAFCYALNPSIFDFFLVSLLKCILQQHPCHAPTWLPDISPLTIPKLSMATLIIFTGPGLWLSTGGQFLNLIIIHALKKARNYYLCQSNRNKCKEGLLACQRAAILPVPQPQSWQAWLQINSIQEALKCIWNLIPSCKILKVSHITC